MWIEEPEADAPLPCASTGAQHGLEGPRRRRRRRAAAFPQTEEQIARAPPVAPPSERLDAEREALGVIPHALPRHVVKDSERARPLAALEAGGERRIVRRRHRPRARLPHSRVARARWAQRSAPAASVRLGVRRVGLRRVGLRRVQLRGRDQLAPLHLLKEAEDSFGLSELLRRTDPRHERERVRRRPSSAEHRVEKDR